MTDKLNIWTERGADVPEESRAVATRTRTWRKKKNLPRDELPRRASVSKGMLVEIEKGAANPSIAILCKLAAALGVSVADIVNVSSEPVVHVIEKQAIPVLWQGAKGGSARLLAGNPRPGTVVKVGGGGGAGGDTSFTRAPPGAQGRANTATGGG